MEKVSAICHHEAMAENDSFPSDAADRFQVRMPPGMRDRIAQAAKNNNRSMNAEIVARLDASLSERLWQISHDHEAMQDIIKATNALVGMVQAGRKPGTRLVMTYEEIHPSERDIMEHEGESDTVEPSPDNKPIKGVRPLDLD